MPILSLRVAKRGAKLAVTDGGPYAVTRRRKSILFHNISMADFARHLSDSFPSDELSLMVKDETGLAGNYDFILHWVPAPATSRSSDSPVDAPPSIFEALSELGLKVSSQKTLVPVVVVDKAEQPRELN